jgi:predicted ATPase
MITSIRLRNFKAHRDTTVSLGRLTVLVGPNGAGKTSVLQALNWMPELVSMASEGTFRADVNPVDLLHRSGDGPISIAEEGREDGHDWRVSAEVPVPKAGAIVPLRLKVSWNEEAYHPDAVGPAILYRFDARRIADVAYSSEESPSVDEDGGNTAVVLAALKLEREEVFTQIEEELRKIVPNVQRIRVRRVKMLADHSSGDQVGHKVFLDFEGASDIPAHGASAGTLITLALLTALCSPSRPRVLLLDDIDQALHPQAQVELMRELKRLLENFPAVQLVATTHSPYILDELEPADIRVFALRGDGAVACRSLSEHPQAEKMRGALTSGQLWSLDPEWRWVIGES